MSFPPHLWRRGSGRLLLHILTTDHIREWLLSTAVGRGEEIFPEWRAAKVLKSFLSQINFSFVFVRNTKFES